MLVKGTHGRRKHEHRHNRPKSLTQSPVVAKSKRMQDMHPTTTSIPSEGQHLVLFRQTIQTQSRVGTGYHCREVPLWNHDGAITHPDVIWVSWWWSCFVNYSYKFRNAPVPHPTMHHSEQKCAHMNGVLWDVEQVHCGIFRLFYRHPMSLSWANKRARVTVADPISPTLSNFLNFKCCIKRVQSWKVFF